MASPSLSQRIRPLRFIEWALEAGVLVVVVGTVAAFGAVHPWSHPGLWIVAGLLLLLVLARAAAVHRLRRVSGGRRTLAVLFRAGQDRKRQGSRRDHFWRLDLSRPLIPRPPLVLPGLALALWAFLQLVPLPPSGHRITVLPEETWRGLLFILAFVVVHVAAAIVLERQEVRARFRRRLALLGLVLGFVALVQNAAGVDKIYGLFAPWESTTFFGPFVNRNHFAAYMLLLAPLAIDHSRRTWMRYLERIGRAPNVRRRLAALDTGEGTAFLYSLLPTIVILGGLVASTSRGALLAFVASLALGAVAWRRKEGPPLWLVGAACAVMVVGWFGLERLEGRFARSGADAPSRTIVWRDTLAHMGGRWWTGAGLNTYGFAFNRATPWELPRGATPWPQAVTDAVLAGQRPATRVPSDLPGRVWFREAHNDYVQLLAETGLPGLALGLWAAVAVLRHVRRRAWLLMSVTALLLHLLVEFDFQIPAIVALFVVLVAWPARSTGEK